MRNADMFMDLSGFVMSQSLRQPLQPFFGVHMLSLTRLLEEKTIMIKGSELTWQHLGAMQIPWGDNEVIIYEVLQPEWAYLFDVNAKCLIVTDNFGTIMMYEDIESISELGISWAILESDQFYIKATGDFTWDAFLVAARQDTPRTSLALTYQWGQLDRYLNALMHAAYDQLIDWLPVAGGDLNLIIDQGDYDAITGLWSIILPYLTALPATGHYPVSLQPGESGKPGERQSIIRNAHVLQINKTMMIYLFASKLLNGSAPVFEPWMLWKLFQWFGQGRGDDQADRIFDLSPWWG